MIISDFAFESKVNISVTLSLNIPDMGVWFLVHTKD